MAFQLGDAFLGIVLVHSKWSHLEAAGAANRGRSPGTSGRPLAVEVFFTKSVSAFIEDLLVRPGRVAGSPIARRDGAIDRTDRALLHHSPGQKGAVPEP